jgi:hypothetical protein
MAAWKLTVRARGSVRKERFDASRAAWNALAAAVREHEAGPPREAVDLRVRRFEPVQQVAARVELAGPGLRCGVDVRGDGSAEAWHGRLAKRLVEPRQGETSVQALRRELEDQARPRG